MNEVIALGLEAIRQKAREDGYKEGLIEGQRLTEVERKALGLLRRHLKYAGPWLLRFDRRLFEKGFTLPRVTEGKLEIRDLGLSTDLISQCIEIRLVDE